ncbi:MAG: RNA-binding domain-containing protein [Spirochaetales bacterium]
MTPQTLANLIALGEGQHLEFKQALPDDLGRELCAMANGSGGQVLIGVADDGTFHPVVNANRVVSQVQDHARNCDPPIAITVEVVGGVIVIGIESSRDKPHSTKGVFYLREGANCQKMNRNQLRDFFFNEGLIYFDSAINPEFRLERDLSDAAWSSFTRLARIPAGLDRNDTLRNLKLTTEAGMTNAGALVFGRPATHFLVSAKVFCVVFQGTEKVTILDQKLYESDMASNVESVMVYLKAHLNTRYEIGGGPRKEILELPEVALREAVVNALVHRDYRSPANVQVHIFQNRVEISTNWFSVTFFRTGEESTQESSQESSQEISEVDKKILQLLEGRPKLTAALLAVELGLTDRAIKKHFAVLQAKGKLKRIGSTKAGHWEVTP